MTKGIKVALVELGGLDLVVILRLLSLIWSSLWGLHGLLLLLVGSDSGLGSGNGSLGGGEWVLDAGRGLGDRGGVGLWGGSGVLGWSSSGGVGLGLSSSGGYVGVLGSGAIHLSSTS